MYGQYDPQQLALYDGEGPLPGQYGVPLFAPFTAFVTGVVAAVTSIASPASTSKSAATSIVGAIVNEPPCILGYRTFADIFSLGISSWVRKNREVEYIKLQKLEEKIQQKRSDWKRLDAIKDGKKRNAINDEICKLIEKKIAVTKQLSIEKQRRDKQEREAAKKQQQRMMEQGLPQEQAYIPPTDPLTGGGAAPADAQTAMVPPPESGGSSTTTLLLLGGGALVLFLLMRGKKSEAAPASSFKGF